MGIFGKITGIFRRKKGEPSLEEPPDLGPLTPLRTEERPLPPSAEPLSPAHRPTSLEPLPPPPGLQTRISPERESIDVSNIKAKLDLLLTQMESVKIQNKNVEERLKSIEKMLAEMRGIRYY